MEPFKGKILFVLVHVQNEPHCLQKNEPHCHLSFRQNEPSFAPGSDIRDLI